MSSALSHPSAKPVIVGAVRPQHEAVPMTGNAAEAVSIQGTSVVMESAHVSPAQTTVKGETLSMQAEHTPEYSCRSDCDNSFHTVLLNSDLAMNLVKRGHYSAPEPVENRKKQFVRFS